MGRQGAGFVSNAAAVAGAGQGSGTWLLPPTGPVLRGAPLLLPLPLLGDPVVPFYLPPNFENLTLPIRFPRKGQLHSVGGCKSTLLNP